MFRDNYQRSMEGSSRLLRLVYAISGVLLWLLILQINPCSSLGLNSSIRCLPSEREALLAFKQGLVEYDNAGLGLLSSWGGSRVDCCRWKGVYCDNLTGYVIKLSLGDGDHLYSLRGTISPKLTELWHLKYLDLSTIGFNGNQIPEFIGSLINLRHLDLSYANFSGQIPYQLGNLTNLQYLDLSLNDLTNPENLSWLPLLSSLEHLNLSHINLGNVSDWFETINKLPRLRSLTLVQCSLPPLVFPTSSLSYINSSKSLASVHIYSESYAVMPPSIFKWLCNSSTTLVDLDLSNIQLSSPIAIPDCFGNMTSLESLSLSNIIQLKGEIPPSFAKLCNLRTLSLQNYNLSGQFQEIVEILSACGQHSLEGLYLSNNNIAGTLPDLTNFSSLKQLSLFANRLTGKIPESVGQMPNLELFYVDHNALEGVISETHFSKLSKLQYLDLSSNSLVLNFHSEWVPPFQLDLIYLGSCNMGHHFPKWLRTQKNYSRLDLSSTGISDFLPSWFWGLSSKVAYLDLSCNQIRGTLGNMTLESIYGPQLNFSSNQLEGAVLTSLANASSLDLSNNKISGLNSFLCNNITRSNLVFLDLSSNHVSEQLLDCWTNLENLLMLDLSNNSLTGTIPSTIGNLLQIESLNLRSNKLSGQLPSSLKNCVHLSVIDLGENELSGTIPEWLGISLSNLVILSLQSNHLSGSLPSQLCHLSNIQMLDFSMNKISGAIPKCLNNLTRLAQKGNTSSSIRHSYNITSRGSTLTMIYSDYYEDEAIFIWKGKVSTYRSTLGLMKRIDFSSNRLTGEIPSEVTHLVGLVALNLSGNQLTGQIPLEIGNLQSLDSLDLSRNQIDGRIPISLARIDGISSLDLSNNNLSGKIPNAIHLQTFEAAYDGNPQLCGPPLQKRCPEEEASPEKRPLQNQEAKDDELINHGFYISMAVGFVVGFWGVCGSLIFNRSWRYAYIKFLNFLNDWLYVRVTLIMLQIREMLNRRA